MTVKDLITKLQALPPDAHAAWYSECGPRGIVEIEIEDVHDLGGAHYDDCVRVRCVWCSLHKPLVTAVIMT